MQMIAVGSEVGLAGIAARATLNETRAVVAQANR
jgi:hypothetical protein